MEDYLPFENGLNWVLDGQSEDTFAHELPFPDWSPHDVKFDSEMDIPSLITRTMMNRQHPKDVDVYHLWAPEVGIPTYRNRWFETCVSGCSVAPRGSALRAGVICLSLCTFVPRDKRRELSSFLQSFATSRSLGAASDFFGGMTCVYNGSSFIVGGQLREAFDTLYPSLVPWIRIALDGNLVWTMSQALFFLLIGELIIADNSVYALVHTILCKNIVMPADAPDVKLIHSNVETNNPVQVSHLLLDSEWQVDDMDWPAVFEPACSDFKKHSFLVHLHTGRLPSWAIDHDEPVRSDGPFTDDLVNWWTKRFLFALGAGFQDRFVCQLGAPRLHAVYYGVMMMCGETVPEPQPDDQEQVAFLCNFDCRRLRLSPDRIDAILEGDFILS